MRTLYLFSLALVVLLSVLAMAYDRLPGDLALALWVQSLATPPLDEIMKGVSLLGSQPVIFSVVAAVIAVLLAFRRQRTALVLFMAATGGAIVVFVLKQAIGRPRPTEELVRVIENASSTGSYPSGHVFSVVLVTGLVAGLFLISLRHIRLRWVLMGLLALFVFVQAMSRVYLGVHWPSDVLGSVLLGIPIVGGLLALHERRSGPRGPER